MTLNDIYLVVYMIDGARIVDGSDSFLLDCKIKFLEYAFACYIAMTVPFLIIVNNLNTLDTDKLYFLFEIWNNYNNKVCKNIIYNNNLFIDFNLFYLNTSLNSHFNNLIFLNDNIVLINSLKWDKFLNHYYINIYNADINIYDNYIFN